MSYALEPVAVVRSARLDPVDDDWDQVPASLLLEPTFEPESLAGLEAFSHLVVVYLFDRLAPERIVVGSRRPRGNPRWPKLGIFAQRARCRPNRLGVSTCALESIEGRVLHVRGLDAIDGTPVLDIKPYMASFGPRGLVREPPWVAELMADYWTRAD